MQVEIRLRQVLQDHGLDGFGVVQRIARDQRMHRHTVGKLYRNDSKNPSLKHLGAVCDWLREHGVPAEKLPQALFGARPSRLWSAISAPGKVVVYLGEYMETREGYPTIRWVSRRDAALQAMITKQLCMPNEILGQVPRIHAGYVPFRYQFGQQQLQPSRFNADKEAAEGIFETMGAAEEPQTSILIGRQHVNYLLELLVAELFGCEPFHPPGDTPRIPFYLVYRRRDRAVPSCFGGQESPPAYGEGEAPAGTYYLDGDGRWVGCPWREDEEDAAVVITVYHPGTRRLEMALFGFSGRATEALGPQLLQHDECFWPPGVKTKEKQVGVYLCHFTGSADGNDGQGYGDCQIVPIHKKLLERYLA